MKTLVRLLGLAVIAAVFLVPAGANAGIYKVKSCWNYGPNSDSSLGHYSSNVPNKFEFDDECGSSNFVLGYAIGGKSTSSGGSTSYPEGSIARIKFTVPGSYLGIAGVEAQTYTEFRGSYGGWRINYVFHDYGANAVVAPEPGGYIAPLDFDLPNGQTRSQFEMNIRCKVGPCSAVYFHPFSRMSNVTLFVKDSELPIAAYDGSLFSSGVKSGVQTASTIGVDGGSGVRWAMLMVNGTWVGIDQAPGQGSGVSCDPTNPTYNSYDPCPHVYIKQWGLDTSKPPFVNGSNNVNACVLDYSGNSSCSGVTHVSVQN